jgi:TolB-like protein/Flp pilus assembly protein TadD
LEGKPEQLKETVIGVEVFGRKPDYDPHRDSVVRTEVAKLRARLLEYYAGAGADDPVIIEIPKGGYVPVVRFASTATQPANRRRGWTAAIAAAVLLLAGIAAYRAILQPRPGAGPEGPLSVAVLPFLNLSPDASDEYFSDGLTEEIINALTKVEGLRVPARGSAFSFKGKQVDIREIGSKFHAEMVLEGTVRRERERVRITAQLSKVADGYQVWSQAYDREMKDVLAIQDEIARSIAATFKVKFVAAANPKGPTGNPEAYNLYLKGRYFQNQGAMPESQKKAVLHFEQAIEKDPVSASAYAGLSDAWHTIGVENPASPEAFPKAEAAARKALEIDDTLSEAHAALANVGVAKWDWQGAEREFRRAIELNPNNARAHLQYALSCLALTDRLDQALQEAERVQALDLVSPEVHGRFAMLLHCARQYDRAIGLARKALEMNPKAVGAQNMLGRSYAQKGMLAEAVAAFETAEGFSARRSHWAASLVGLYVKSGRRAEAEKLAEIWKRRPRREFSHAESMAMVYAGLGDRDEAFRWLDQAYQEHWMRLPWIKISPEYDNLRSDSRFQVLMKKMGL